MTAIPRATLRILILDVSKARPTLNLTGRPTFVAEDVAPQQRTLLIRKLLLCEELTSWPTVVCIWDRVTRLFFMGACSSAIGISSFQVFPP